MEFFVLVLVFLGIGGEERSIKFSDYITGDVIVEPKAPSELLHSEEEVFETPRKGWLFYESEGYNTTGFIEDFYCAEMMMEPRKMARGNEEEICVVIPLRETPYRDTVRDFIPAHMPYTEVGTVRIESEYCGKDGYCTQQRVRYIQGTSPKDVSVKACRMIAVEAFLQKDGQIKYRGDMTAEEVRKNCDLLMNEYLNEGRVGIYRTVTEDDDSFKYVFYSYKILREGGESIRLYEHEYVIYKDGGEVEKTENEYLGDAHRWILLPPEELRD